MSTTFSATVNLSILFREVLSGALRTGCVLEQSLVEALDLAPGTLDGQINAAYAATETGIGASVTTAYDLVGSLKSTDGTTLNFDEVVLIAIRNRSATPANYLRIGPAAANGFGMLTGSTGFWADVSDRNIVNADGDSWTVMYSKAGVAATAGTADQLVVITNSATSANTWDIVILGRDN